MVVVTTSWICVRRQARQHATQAYMSFITNSCFSQFKSQTRKDKFNSVKLTFESILSLNVAEEFGQS